MIIRPAIDKDFPIIEQFILPFEQNCVQLASLIKHKAPTIHCIFNTMDDCNPDCASLTGVFSYDSVILSYLAFPEKINQTEFLSYLSELINEKPVKCISGIKTSTDFFVAAINQLGFSQKSSISYELMTLQTEPFSPPEKLSADDEIKRCTYDDLELLLDLQKKYMIKEVVPQGHQLSDLECSIALKNILKNQLCFAIFSDCEPVAKANTNAIGFNWTQIGGVYTHPLYRKNYYAWNLIYRICQRVNNSQKSTCLFVKSNNLPAINLYKRIGFTQNGFYEICYF